MFRILDGRKHFYQWDINQQLEVLNNEILEVHYSTQIYKDALVCEVKEKDGKRVVDVPNILLQDTWDLKVFACCDCYTIGATIFEIKAKPKPEDYVYTETEIKRYDDLEKRIDNLEQGGSVEVDLTNYYTKAETDKAIQDNIPNIDLTGYATESYVNEKVEGIEIQETDLTNYYTKQETDTAISEAIAERDWTLIEETELKESVEVFTRNTEPNGTLYNYKAVVIRADFESAMGEYDASVYSVRANEYSIYAYFTSRNIDTKTSLWASIDNSGYTPSVNCCIANNSGLSLITNCTGIMNSIYKDINYQAAPIRDITISGILPKGVKISIKGVRA